MAATGTSSAPAPVTAPQAPAAGDQDAARRHVLALRQHGGSYRSIAQAAGLAPMTVHALAAGQTRPQRWTTTAVLSVSDTVLRRGRVDAGGTRLRLRALHVMGHGSARIARAAGASPHTIRGLVRGDTDTITRGLRDAITIVYDAWWDKRPPGRTRAQRAAATAARRRALAGNWCPGAALDDDALDIPGYQPSQGWRPALGTGTAGDLTPRPPCARIRRPPVNNFCARTQAGEPAAQASAERPCPPVTSGPGRYTASKDPGSSRPVASTRTTAAGPPAAGTSGIAQPETARVRVGCEASR